MMFLCMAEGGIHALTPAMLMLPAHLAKGELQLLLLLQKSWQKLLCHMTSHIPGLKYM